MGERRISNWLEGYLEITEGIRSPARFRLWAGIVAVAAALERKCWVRIDQGVLYPNMYIWLIGPPATGKTLAYRRAASFLRKVNTINLAPMDVTQAAFYDALQGAMQNAMRERMPYMHHSLTGIVDELGTFIKPGDGNFLVALTKAYDCEEYFEKKTKHSGENEISNVWFNMGAGATPRFLAEIIDEQVIEQGFASRVIFVYSAEKIPSKLFDSPDTQTALRDEDMIHDLEAIHTLNGEFVWSDEAAQAFEEWHDKGMAPRPIDVRLQYYCERRVGHIAKLCMVISAARSPEMLITLEDFEIARGLLLDIEKDMPNAIEFVALNKMWVKMRAVLSFVQAMQPRYPKGVPEHLVIRKLAREVGATYVNFALEALLRAEELEYVNAKPPGRTIRVVERKEQ